MGLGVVTASALVFGGIVWANLQSGVQTFTIAEPTEAAPQPLDAPGGVNILLVGSDSREGQGEEFGEGQDDAAGVLNDVNMVLHLSADQTHATVVSIPRDTIIDTPTCTNDQGVEIEGQEAVPFNSILEEGGMNCIIAATEDMSGLDIQYAAMIQFRGVIEMSNAVGGVEVCVESPIEDPYVGLSLDAGNHNLKGDEALKFLRTRHGVGDGSDLSRISNQQVFLSALMRTVKSNDTLNNPTKLYGIARAATQNMVLSSNLNNVDTLIALATSLARVPLNQFAFVRLPVVESDIWEGKVAPSDDAAIMWDMLVQDKSLVVAPDPSVSAPTETDSSDASSDAEATQDETGGDESTGESPTVDAPTVDSSFGPSASPLPTVLPTLDGQTADVFTCSNTDPLF